MTISLVATNDIHGAVDRMPAIGAHVDVIRKQRDPAGGGVVLLDGGDIFQGTLESNMGEGRAMIELMNEIGYTAAAVGNHEFDFGPIGADATPQKPEQDPRGALKQRLLEAKFPILGANIYEDGAPVRWPGSPASIIEEVAGIKVGIIGLATIETPHTTIAANVVGLEFQPLAKTVEHHARALRNAGAQLVFVTAHAGGKCTEFHSPYDLSSCAEGEEIFELAEALSAGLVDAIVAGHTHRGVAHIVRDIPVIEQFANGEYIGRIDFSIDPIAGEVLGRRIFAPRPVCVEPGSERCVLPASYEDEPLVASAQATRIARQWIDQASKLREQELGISAATAMPASRSHEHALGNWVVSTMLDTRDENDLAITNGGGLRADIEAGPITYGELYRVLPFDNRFAVVQMSGEELERIIANNLSHDGGIFSFAGARVIATCKDADLEIDVLLRGGKKLKKNDRVRVLTTDYLATSKRDFLGLGTVTIEDGKPFRDVLADHLRARGGSVSADDKRLFDAKNLRFRFPSTRPVSCKPPRQASVR